MSNYSIDASMIRALPIPVGKYKLDFKGYTEDQGKMKIFGDLNVFVEAYDG